MHPLHHSLSHYFCLRNWLDSLPHLHPTLSPSPSSLIQRDSLLQRAGRTWFPVKGRGVVCGLCWPCTDTLIHWHFYEPRHHLLKGLFLESCGLLCHRQPLRALSISLFSPSFLIPIFTLLCGICNEDWHLGNLAKIIFITFFFEVRFNTQVHVRPQLLWPVHIKTEFNKLNKWQTKGLLWKINLVWTFLHSASKIA